MQKWNVVLLGWAGSTERNLQAYKRIYQSSGNFKRSNDDASSAAIAQESQPPNTAKVQGQNSVPYEFNNIKIQPCAGNVMWHFPSELVERVEPLRDWLLQLGHVVSKSPATAARNDATPVCLTSK
jgi:hypothetical protein